MANREEEAGVPPNNLMEGLPFVRVGETEIFHVRTLPSCTLKNGVVIQRRGPASFGSFYVPPSEMVNLGRIIMAEGKLYGR